MDFASPVYYFTTDENKLLDEMITLQDNFNAKVGKSLQSNQLNIFFESYVFAQALSDEVVEAKNCFNWKWWTKEGKEHAPFSFIIDKSNYHIELIDMLHFILSFNIMVGVPFQHVELVLLDLEPICRQRLDYNSLKTDNSFRYYLLESLLCEIQKFKDFLITNQHVGPILNLYSIKLQQKPSFDKDFHHHLYSLAKKSWNVLCTLLMYCDGFSFSEIHKMYSLKLNLNHERQTKNYAVLTKTEDDNIQLHEYF